MSEIPEAHEPEIKALHFDPNLLPKEMLEAMLENRDSDYFDRRGPVHQLYLDTSKQHIFDEVIAGLNALDVPFGTSEEQGALGNTEAARELRLMIKPNQGISQLTIKGQPTHGGISCDQLETPEDYSEQVDIVVDKFGLRDYIRGRVDKVWHDLLFDIDGEQIKVEHDILASHNGLMLVEVEPEGDDEAEKIRTLNAWLQAGKLPAIFEQIVHGRKDLKSFHLALHGLPLDIAKQVDAIPADQKRVVQKIMEAYELIPRF